MHKSMIVDMPDNHLLEEIHTQTAWGRDDIFEFTAFGRGDNGMKRDNYIAQLYTEAERRKLLKFFDEKNQPTGGDDNE